MEIKREKRNSSLELLRIISMILIVAHHFAVHSAFGPDISAFNSFVIKVFFSGGKVAVNVFVLISGYFLVESKFKIRRIINVLVPTLIYSILGYLSIAWLKGTPITFKDLLHEALPIRNNAYWFVTCFVALSILSPFINKLIGALNQKQHLALALILVLMQVRFYTIEPVFSISNIGWFITLYIIAGYIKKYPNKVFDKKLYMALAVLVLGTVVALWSYATIINDIFCLALALSMLCLFKNINIKYNKFINLVGAATFGVYLIHDNDFIRPVIWNDILLCPQHAYFKTFWLFAIAMVALVFVSCVLIDWVRMLITKLIVKLFYKIKGRKNEKRVQKI